VRVARWRASANDFLDGLPKPSCAFSKAIFARTPGDEASNGLGILYMLTWLETWIQMKAEVKVETSRQQLEAKRDAFQVGRLRDLVPLVAVAITLYGAAISTVASALFCAIFFPYGFGKDIAKLSLFLHVTAEPTPPGKWSLVQLPPPTEASISDPTARVFSHSSYAHPQVPEVLGQWICGLMDIQSRRASKR
jgi:hypothetical protein